MGRVHGDVLKLMEEQLRYDTYSKEYIDLQMEIAKMVKKFTVEYEYEDEDEDGFSVVRGRNTFKVYGTCKGEYTFYHADGKEYTPEENELERDHYTCIVSCVYNECEREVDLTLTTAEYKAFEAYMLDKLDNKAEEYCGSKN